MPKIPALIKNLVKDGVITRNIIIIIACLAAAILFIIGFSEYTRADWGIIGLLIVIFTLLVEDKLANKK